jgi:hypothetical protein
MTRRYRADASYPPTGVSSTNRSPAATITERLYARPGQLPQY